MDTLNKYDYNGFVALAQERLRHAVKPMKNSLHIAYSYLRFSDPSQENGDSLRRQRALRDAWLNRHPRVRLDKTLRFEDKGVSGYTGKHRTDDRHALAQFIRLVEKGRVVPGSYLIVENLDRLTREKPIDSIPAVLNLIAAGIRVVQLAPSEMIYDADMEQHELMSMLWELARGHGESKRKSGLCGEAWMAIKELARKNKKPHGRMCPGWIELTDEGYRLKDGSKETMRKIFAWCAEGLGCFGIVARLNREDVPCFGRSGRWGHAYVKKILADRSVIGEYQPHKGHRAPSRKPEGDPIAGYYPAAIDEPLWYAAQEAKRKRTRRTGRPGTRSFNPFSGLLIDALDGAKLHVVSTNGPAYTYLVSSGAVQKAKGSEWRTFPLKTMVDGLLSMLSELKASSLFSDPGAERITELNGRLAELDKRLSVALAKFEEDPESSTWANKVSQYDREKRLLAIELKEAEMASRHPLSASWAEALELMKHDDPRRLRAALLETIQIIPCVILPRGKTRLAVVQVWFHSGAVRSYIISHKGGNGGAVPKRTIERSAKSYTKMNASNTLDLRIPSHARRLESSLKFEEF